MDLIALTRQLGAAIQEDERYLHFVKAKDDSESDPEVKDMMDKINELREAYQLEAEGANPDEMKLGKLDQDFQTVYTALMVNPNMSKYEEARIELDKMMNYLMQILYLSVNGEDPATCEPHEHDESCGGECSACSGC